MCFATARSLWRPLVSLTRHTSTFLRSWFLTGASHISYCLDAFPKMLSAVLEVFKDVVNNIASQRLIKEFWVERHEFIGETTADEFIDWHSEVFI